MSRAEHIGCRVVRMRSGSPVEIESPARESLRSVGSARHRGLRGGTALLLLATTSGASVHRARSGAAEPARRADDVPAALLRLRAFRGAGERTHQAEAR